MELGFADEGFADEGVDSVTLQALKKRKDVSGGELALKTLHCGGF